MSSLSITLPDDWTANMARILAERLLGELPSEIERIVLTLDDGTVEHVER